MRVLNRNGFRLGVSIATLLTAGVAASGTAQAGAFAVREQSAYYQGMSFAGTAAGDDLSSMFWNSAAAAAAPGINSETSVALVIPHTEVTSTGTSVLDAPPPFGFGLDTHSGDIGDPTPVPASYFNYQLSDRLFFGLAINGQYGFTTKPDNLDFAGTPIATTSHIFSTNINPNLAYKLTPDITIGIGAQIMYAELRLRSSNTLNLTPFGLPVVPGRTTEADDWGFGATAGIIWKVDPATTIGVGYRSAIELEGKGTCTGLGLSNLVAGLQGGNAAGCLVPGGAHVTADLTLPDMVTGSFRHNLTDRLALLGTVEWTNWSRVGAQASFKNGAGQVVDVFPLDYDDGWLFSAGLEYKWSPDITLRTGAGYEISPISTKNRNVSLPDNDRIWLSAGGSYKFSEKLSFDLAYTHLFVKDAKIETSATFPPPVNTVTLIDAEATGDIDIITAAFKYNWGGAERELEPLK
jgi:long-chain fatty acid transport protein